MTDHSATEFENLTTENKSDAGEASRVESGGSATPNISEVVAVSQDEENMLGGKELEVTSADEEATADQEPPFATDTNEEEATDPEALQVASKPFVGKWNNLVSTTNWDKGAIICQWRETLIEEGAPVVDHSDEAWAALVGNVTGQHVGRLRRVYQQYGNVYRDYAGLFWSHFQAALDWEDAEMWLEGAVQNKWSISQMRGQRWEALGAPEDLKPRDEDIVMAELDEDADPNLDLADPSSTAEVSEGAEFDGSLTGEGEEDTHPEESLAESGLEAQGLDRNMPALRPFAKLGPLPEDVSEAVEQFKLVIVSHKMTEWDTITKENMLSCLDALRELLMAPSAEEEAS